LDGARRAEGGARSAGVLAGGELGGADRAPRHHRPHGADRFAAGTREDRAGAAAADRRPVESVGHHGAVGGDARRRHSERAAGRDVARGAGGAREAGAHHPRTGGDGDRAIVSGSGEVVPRQPDGAASARDEHALRGTEGEGRADADSEQRRRIDGHGRPDGRGGAAAAEAHRRPRRRSESGVGVSAWYPDGMRTTIDKAGRLVIPAPLRQRAGLSAGAEVELTEDELGLRLTRVAPGPRLVKVGARLVARPTAAPDTRPSIDVAALIEEERNRWP